jgi:hypothetical protein
MSAVFGDGISSNHAPGRKHMAEHTAGRDQAAIGA